MSDNLVSLLSSLEELPTEDIDTMGNGMADHLLAGMANGGFERGLLTCDPAELQEMKAVMLETFRKDFIDRVSRIIPKNPRVKGAIAQLSNPYALGVVNEVNALGFESNLVVASDPLDVTYADAERLGSYRKDVRPYLLQMPEGRALRTPNEKLWIPGTKWFKDTPASGRGDRYFPGCTTSYANVMDSTTRAVSDSEVSQTRAFVEAVLVPLATVKAFVPDAKPAPYVNNGMLRGGGH